MKTSLAVYRELARDHNLIPVVKEVLADTETPVSVLGKFANRERVFLLESVEGGETWGRYSFIGVDPEPFLELDHSAAALNQAQSPWGQLEQLRSIFKNVRPVFYSQ